MIETTTTTDERAIEKRSSLLNNNRPEMAAPKTRSTIHPTPTRTREERPDRSIIANDRLEDHVDELETFRVDGEARDARSIEWLVASDEWRSSLTTRRRALVNHWLTCDTDSLLDAASRALSSAVGNGESR